MSLSVLPEKSINSLCSSQVITTLPIAVKELVENALDASSTTIQVKCKDSGITSIQVIDNGHGISECDIPNLCQGHSTSKLRQFDDLSTFSTLGFRGEALKSLASTGKLSIVTRSSDSPKAFSLEFNDAGELTRQVATNRTVGTTVTVQDLFHRLPVRRKELSQNGKQQFQKVYSMLVAYSLARPEVSVSLTNDVRSGLICLLHKPSVSTIKDSIAQLFGSSQLSELVELIQAAPSETALEEFGLQSKSSLDIRFKFSGFISNVDSGRSRSDRQYLFVNRRPCQYGKIERLLNQVYRQFEKKRCPVLIVFVEVDAKDVDVNLTPDKRSVLLVQESLLLAALKTAVSNALEGQIKSSQPAILKRADVGPFSAFLSQGASSPKRPRVPLASSSSSQPNCLNQQSETIFPEEDFLSTQQLSDTMDQDQFLPTQKTSTKQPSTSSSLPLKPSFNFNSSSSANSVACSSLGSSEGVCSKVALEGPKTAGTHGPSTAGEPVEEEHQLIKTSFQLSHVVKTRQSHAVPCCYDDLAEEFLLLRQASRCQFASTGASFYASLEPEQKDLAEEELGRHLKKSDFSRMIIIGQFNHGFIVCRCKENVFIVDQHAADEKYNFEDLQLNFRMKSQTLLAPEQLRLSPIYEDLLKENVELFELNGFRFNIEPSLPTGSQVRLTSMPTSKNWTFGKDDIDEMLFVLSETNVATKRLRPSRVRDMLASRACRKSVMIGGPLDQRQMRRIILNMGTMLHPWNCPHGRPTIRHLFNLRSLIKSFC